MRKADGSGDSPETLSDEELLSRYRDEDRSEFFDALVHRYERELYRYLARYLGDASLAEDVFQNTFLQVHLKKHLYEDGRPVRPWLYAIATHQGVDAMRKAGRHPAVSLDQKTGGEDGDLGSLVDLLVSSEVGPVSRLQGEERADWIRNAVGRLPEILRQTLILAYYQDMKYRDIAESLGIPVGTVKSRLHAAISKLQEMANAADLDANE